MPDLFEEIDNGILEVPKEHASLLKSANIRDVFLDRLILPAPLGSLTEPQVVTINRFRERERETDAQFQKADRSRSLMLKALEGIQAGRLIEIGMGKYPLATNLTLTDYFGIDIDKEAVDYCRGLGLQAGKYIDILGEYDSAAAIYSLHFSFEKELIEMICLHGTKNLVLIACIIDDSSGNFSNIISKLSENFAVNRVLESKNSEREKWVLSSSRDGLDRLNIAYEIIRHDITDPH